MDTFKILQEKIAGLILMARALVAFTGAGISTSAGIPDFRGEKGIYTTGQYPPEVFDIEAFMRDPSVFYAYARGFVEQEPDMHPSFTHSFLARLEAAGHLTGIVTQNIDGLHQKAGSRDVIELHGGYRQNYCTRCGKQYGYEALKAKLAEAQVPRCDACSGVIKPDIVFFGEPVKAFDTARQKVSMADTLLVIGTSLTVYPAALLPSLVRGEIVIVNKGGAGLTGPNVTAVDADIDEFFRGVSAP